MEYVCAARTKGEVACLKLSGSRLIGRVAVAVFDAFAEFGDYAAVAAGIELSGYPVRRWRSRSRVGRWLRRWVILNERLELVALSDQAGGVIQQDRMSTLTSDRLWSFNRCSNSEDR